MVQQNIALYANMGCPLKFYGQHIVSGPDTSLLLHKYVAKQLRHNTDYYNTRFIDLIDDNDESISLALFRFNCSEFFNFLNKTQTIDDFLRQYTHIANDSTYEVMFHKSHICG